jgi:hypothetical protein
VLTTACTFGVAATRSTRGHVVGFGIGPFNRRPRLLSLTFELAGRNRHGAWHAKLTMDQSASQARCHAGRGLRSIEGLGLSETQVDVRCVYVKERCSR